MSSTQGSSSLLKRNSEDIGCEFGYLCDPNNLDKVMCKLCDKEMYGGVNRLKQHIGHIKGNVSKCPKSTKEEQEKCRNSIYEVRGKKRAKMAREEEVRNEVTIGDNEEDEEGLEEIGSSGPRKIGPMDKFTSSIDPSIPLATRQPSIKEHIMKEKIHKCNQYVVRWLYTDGVAFNAINNYEFKQMVEAIGRFGPNYPGPTQYERREKLLKEEVERTKDLLKAHVEERALAGVENIDTRYPHG